MKRKEAFIVNAGDKVRNIFTEMGGRGVLLTTSRNTMGPLLENYLDAGLFLKKLVYGFDAKLVRNQKIKLTNGYPVLGKVHMPST